MFTGMFNVCKRYKHFIHIEKGNSILVGKQQHTILYIAIVSIAYWSTVSTNIETYKSKVKHGLYFSI